MLRIKKIILKLIRLSRGTVINNILIVGLVSLVVKGTSFLKELAIASYLGVSELLDTFLIALLIPGFISNVFLGSYKAIFIPNYIYAKKRGENCAQFLSSSLIITFVTAFFFIGVALVFGDFYLEFFFKGHTPEYYLLIKKQLYVLLPCIILWSFSSLLSGLLNIDKEFFWSSLNGVFIPLTSLSCLIFFKDQLGEIVLSFGVLSGSLLNVIYLLIIAKKRRILVLAIPNIKSAGIIQMVKQIPAKISSALINGLNEPVDQFFSAQMAIGSISALNYGLKLPAFAIGILSISIGNVILPYFSEIASISLGAVFKRLQKILLVLLLTCSLFSLLLIVFSESLIGFVFERNQFTNKDTQTIFPILQMYSLQIPFYVIGIVLNRFLTSINKNNFLVISSTISLLLNIALNYWLIDILGIKGLALSTSLVSLLNTIVIYIYIKSLKSKYYV